MSRTLAVLAVVAVGVLVYASGGHLGPVNLNRVPAPFFAFGVLSILVVFGISRL